jgi:hypothetical protein
MMSLNNVALTPETARGIIKYLSDRHGLAPEEARRRCSAERRRSTIRTRPTRRCTVCAARATRSARPQRTADGRSGSGCSPSSPLLPGIDGGSGGFRTRRWRWWKAAGGEAAQPGRAEGGLTTANPLKAQDHLAGASR